MVRVTFAPHLVGLSLRSSQLGSASESPGEGGPFHKDPDTVGPCQDGGRSSFKSSSKRFSHHLLIIDSLRSITCRFREERLVGEKGLYFKLFIKRDLVSQEYKGKKVLYERVDSQVF